MIYLRHFRQRHRAGATFRFRRATRYADVHYPEGAVIPDALRHDRRRLSRCWEEGRLELVIFEDGDQVEETAAVEDGVAQEAEHEVVATEGDDVDGDGEADVLAGYEVVQHGGGWYEIVLPGGESKKVQGRAALAEALEALGEQSEEAG